MVKILSKIKISCAAFLATSEFEYRQESSAGQVSPEMLLHSIYKKILLVVLLVITAAVTTVYDTRAQRLPARITSSQAISVALPAASEVGVDDFRISDVGPDGDRNFDAFDPAVAYNPVTNEYLVVWEGDEFFNEFEIYGQRIDAATGAEIGANDFRISDMGDDGDASRAAGNPAVAYNSATNEFLVVWFGDDSRDQVEDIYGQRLDATGNEIGVNDFQISDVGVAPGGLARFQAQDPAVIYNSMANEFLVVWASDVIANGNFEIYGQCLDASGNEIGPDNFQISDMGIPTSTAFVGRHVTVAHNKTTNE